MSTDAVGAHRRLYVPPTVIHFRRDRRDALVTTLREMGDNTMLQSPAEPQELQLRDDCTTVDGGYTYTTHGFKQLASILGPGVGRMIPDLAGTRRRDVPDAYLNGIMAIRMLNSLIDLRFSAFDSHRMVCNTRTRMIDGFVGSAHQFLDNLLFFEAVSQAVEQGIDIEFYAASLVGRRLFMWWRARQPCLMVQAGNKTWPIYQGYYFCNGESAGASVRATLALFTPVGICLGPYKHYGARITHRGRDFMVRLAAELQRTMLRELPLDEWRANIPAAINQSLGFETARELRPRKLRISALTTILRKFGVDSSLANEILTSALNIGREIGDPNAVPRYQLDQLYASRTALDLLVCLLHLARRLDMSRRERLEQTAFHLLIGKFF